MEAKIVIAKCAKSKKTFGIRVEKIGGQWHMTWAFKIKETTAAHEGFEKTKISGDFCMDSEFPGCPHCSAQSIIYCGCTKISCYDESDAAECAWCGNQSKPEAGHNFEVASGDY